MFAGMALLNLALRSRSALGTVWRREGGQAMVEYALVLFLVALVSIAILGTLGGSVASMLSVVNAEF
jgi:Flp pilus assembly pilin Flp